MVVTVKMVHCGFIIICGVLIFGELMINEIKCYLKSDIWPPFVAADPYHSWIHVLFKLQNPWKLMPTNTLESLKIFRGSISWFFWVALPHKFTSSMKNKFRMSFLSHWNQKPRHPRNYIPWLSKIPTIYKNWLPQN